MEKNRKYILLGLILIILSVVVYGLFSWRREQAVIMNAPRIGGRFLPTASAVPLSEDEIQASRLLRGEILSVGEDGAIALSTYVNWPDHTQRAETQITTTAQTQYLCWPSVQEFNGQQVKISESAFFISDTTRLELVEQRLITKEDAASMLNRSPKEVLIALQQAYNRVGSNVAYQVAIVGCQDEQ